MILHQRLLCKTGAGPLGFLQKNLEPGGIATETVDRFPVCKSRLQAAADKAENSHNWCDILPREAPSSLSSGRLRGGTHRETGRLSEQRCVLPHPSLNHPALPDPVLEPHAASWCPRSHHSSITAFSLHSPPGASHPHLWPDGTAPRSGAGEQSTETEFHLCRHHGRRNAPGSGFQDKEQGKARCRWGGGDGRERGLAGVQSGPQAEVLGSPLRSKA